MLTFAIPGVPDLHGLPVPVIQYPGEYEQLRRAVWLRVHLDRGAVQARGLAGPDVRHSEADRQEGD